MEPNLSNRAKQTLKSLVDLYIANGAPVGSKTLAQLPDLACSPATVRNVMSELEAAGLIHSPHTSAGRVPTAKGYRLFVDSFLTVQPLEQLVQEHLQQSVQDKADPKAIIESASTVLSGLTHMAGVVTTPKRNQVKLRQVEFLKLSRQKILVILVLDHGDVQNRIILTPREYSDSELVQAGNYLTQEFAGQPLEKVKAALLQLMQDEKQQIDDLMQLAMKVAEDGFEDSQTDYVLSGQANLLNLAQDQGVDQLKTLFDDFTQKQAILQLFDQSLKADGVQIYIGEESGFTLFDNCSVITAPYQIDQEAVGMIGVIGPTRMEYNKVVPIVDMTAKLLSMVLDK